MTEDKKQSLELDFCGIPFASPVVLLSGCVGFGNEYSRIAGYSNRDIGAVCLKSLTIEPRKGNLPHRLYETPAGMLNAIGLQNPGVDYFLHKILGGLKFEETRYIANIAGFSIAEYVKLAEKLEDTPVDGIEINLSCPNAKGSGLDFCHDWGFSAHLVAACRKVTKKPLITKLSSSSNRLKEGVRRCIEAGSDAFAVTNTIPGMAVDIRKKKPVLASVQGGLSGAAIKPIALLAVKTAYEECKLHGVPIIGQGGISSVEDAIEFLLVGATAVGLGTALSTDELLARKINRGILEYLKQEEISCLSELTGALEYPEETAH